MRSSVSSILNICKPAKTKTMSQLTQSYTQTFSHTHSRAFKHTQKFSTNNKDLHCPHAYTFDTYHVWFVLCLCFCVFSLTSTVHASNDVVMLRPTFKVPFPHAQVPAVHVVVTENPVSGTCYDVTTYFQSLFLPCTSALLQ